jgi:septum formation protein
MPLWLAGAPLLLASRSKARQALLEHAGIPVEVEPTDLDERALEKTAPSQQPGEIAAFLAREKAAAVARHSPGRLTLGADQTLALGTERFAKPTDRAGARAQLRALAGTTHELYTAVALLQDTHIGFEIVSVARLTMRALSDHFIDAYLDQAGDSVTASVGAYQLEGLGAQLFDRVEGDYFTVLGLPLLDVLAFLRRHGSLAL